MLMFCHIKWNMIRNMKYIKTKYCRQGLIGWTNTIQNFHFTFLYQNICPECSNFVFTFDSIYCYAGQILNFQPCPCFIFMWINYFYSRQLECNVLYYKPWCLSKTKWKKVFLKSQCANIFFLLLHFLINDASSVNVLLKWWIINTIMTNKC